MTATTEYWTASPAPQTDQTNTEPTLKGWITTYFRYHKGKKLGPYYIRRWKHNGKTFKEYIKLADLEKVKKACQANREKRQRQQLTSLRCQCLLRNFKLLCHVQTRLDNDQFVRPDLARHVEYITRNGPFVPGCPPLRRRRAFMAPFSINDFLASLTKTINDAWQAAHKPQPAFMAPSTSKQNNASTIPYCEPRLPYHTSRNRKSAIGNQAIPQVPAGIGLAF